jgi:hypothetical protein
MSRDAVIGHIKRQREAGPEQDMLATFVRNEQGGIVGLERTPLRIVRDATGRPVGIGKAV